jgi:hypothetical protein
MFKGIWRRESRYGMYADKTTCAALVMPFTT